MTSAPSTAFHVLIHQLLAQMHTQQYLQQRGVAQPNWTHVDVLGTPTQKLAIGKIRWNVSSPLQQVGFPLSILLHGLGNESIRHEGLGRG